MPSLPMMLGFIMPMLGNPMTATELRCEYLRNPEGIDAVRPRLSWIVSSSQRGDRPTAYQILVTKSPAGKEVLWDSGKVASPSLGAEYAGRALGSGDRCFWKVRAWNRQNEAGPWSEAGSWSMGLLRRADWRARWISSPLLADSGNRPRTPIHCYRSELSTDEYREKWVALDLGAVHSVDRITLAPARPNGLTFDIGTVQFPRRFRLEGAGRVDFSDAKVLVDQTGGDYPEPRGNVCEFKFPAAEVRYVRLVAAKLGKWDARDFGIFLAQFSAFAGAENVALGAKVTASDSLEEGGWSTRYLVDGKPNVEFSAFPAALDPKVEGAFSSSRSVSLRKEFQLEAPVRRAMLYGTARGFYEARINGQRVGDGLLAPGFTDFHRRLSVQAYDVTAMLRQGANSVGALLGYGWYAGHMNLAGNAYLYGYFPQLAAQLEIELTNGRRVTIATDSSWRTSLEGPIRWSDLLEGEAYDARREMPGWDRAGFADGAWETAWSQDLGEELLTASKMPPVRAIQEMKPVSRKEVRPGVWVYDLGQEITGWVRVKLDGPAGTHVVIRHAEAVTPAGELDVASLWGTPQREDYLLDGGGARFFEPHFTYHGFRYFEISGLHSAPEDVVAINVHNDLEEVGKFECSNPLFNRLMTASLWTQRNLLFDVPAGCAARSERLAWTGDIRPCVQTALFNFDSAAFFEKYAVDLCDDQKADGRFTDITPHAHLTGSEICVGSPGWADAGVSLPWEVYVNTGDRQLIAAHYESAKRWVDFIYRENPNLIWANRRGMDWGDWLSAGPATPKELGSTAFFAHSADLVARMAQVLGKKGDASAYAKLFKGIKAAFVARYATADGVLRQPAAGHRADVLPILRRAMREGKPTLDVNNEALGGDPSPNVPKLLVVRLEIDGKVEQREYAEGRQVDLTWRGKAPKILEATYGASHAQEEADVQGSYALALQFGLLEGTLRTKAIDRLAALIERDHGHPTTGFWSSVELLLALSDAGHHEVASRLANLTTAPSLGHMVTSGGTTFWEAFDADQKTLSLNHWTHSACGEWLWRNVAGLNPDPEHPGYEVFTVRPRPSAEVTWCKTEYRSVRGPIGIEWHAENGSFWLELRVPPGSKARVVLPVAVREPGEGVRVIGKEQGRPVYEVESGSYRFEAGR